VGSDDDESWRVHDVLQITVNDLTVEAGDHRVRVIAESGIDDTFLFFQA
jgi:archaellum component FlaG (FlaF/FlaG flagellin family)